jgi:tetratricopeptide (TPR) repeat protein
MGFDKAKAIRAAEKYLAQGKIPSALQEYLRIVEHEADDFNALNTLGDLYARVERKEEAASCFRRVAEHYREQGFTLKAVAMYKKLSRFSPNDHKTALALASLYEQQGLMIDARQQYLVAADAFARGGNSREALDVLRRIADLDPSNTQIRLRLAESFAGENLPDLAAEAYAEAGARLAARKEFEAALDAFTKSLTLRPASHPALHGLLSAHTALGTADEAAEVLEQAIRERPGDLEVRAMLARAYVDAEDAARAESATRELVSRDPSSFMVLFDVVRLYLRQGATEDATRLLGWVVEPALAARQESPLIELLNEVLARNPEQLEAHHMLVRAYYSTRDDEQLRTALERLADAAEATGAVDDERRALTRLAALAPNEQGNLARLEELGGPLYDEAEERARAAAEQTPTFESFMLNDDAAPPQTAASATTTTSAPEFEWNSVAGQQPAPPTADASASFADLNDLTDDGGNGQEQYTPPDSQEQQTPRVDYQEFDFGMHLPGAGTAAAGDQSQPQGTNVERMLRQELESVTFYIEQGYADIARDTLEMLEGQYGQHAEIDALRTRLANAATSETTKTSETTAGFDASAAFEAETSAAFETAAPYDSTTFETTAFETTTFETTAFESPATFESASADDGSAGGVTNAFAPDAPQGTAHNSQPRAAGAEAAGIDPGLAAIFDEFREAVEDAGDDDAGADFETHYQMGLAYREMGLLDKAVEEFQAAVALSAPGDGTPRFLQSCNMLGHCFMEKGMPRPAVLWFKRGLEAPGHSEDEYQAMRYDLGTAYEQMGDNGRAIEVLSEVYAIDVSYRGVADRLRELQKASK